MTAFNAFVKNHLGVLAKDIILVDGLAGLPPDMVDVMGDDAENVAKLDGAFSGATQAFAKFLLCEWDDETQSFVLVREPLER